MEEQPATLQGVTVAEAAAILGVSTATVRRMVKRGDLEGQRVIRPQGTAFVIMLPEQASDDVQDASDTLHEAGVTPRDNASPAGQLAAWSETFLLPLVAALERSQVTVREQAETIGRQSSELERLADRVGVLTAENEMLRAPPAPPDASGASEPDEPATEPAPRPEPSTVPQSSEAPKTGFEPFTWRLILLYVILLVVLVGSTLMLALGLF